MENSLFLAAPILRHGTILQRPIMQDFRCICQMHCLETWSGPSVIRWDILLIRGPSAQKHHVLKKTLHFSNALFPKSLPFFVEMWGSYILQKFFIYVTRSAILVLVAVQSHLQKT